MLDKHGFTLIEVIFTFSVIVVLSLLTLKMSVLSPPHLSFEQQCNHIINFLQEAKTQAILHHEKIDILIGNNQISYHYREDMFLYLDANYYFENNFELYFNENGNINGGNHLNICNSHECKSIVFNVGSGSFYVKK